MKDVDYINAYAMALAQFNLMQIKQENEMLKATAGAPSPMPAYMFLPVPKPENIMPNCFESIKPPENDDYKKGWLDGWIACTDYFIKYEGHRDKGWRL